MLRPLALAVAVLASATSAVAQSPPPSPAAGPVVVTVGHATVDRAPDRAYVTLATETRAPRPDDAQKRNAELMGKVQQAVRKARIPQEAVRTVGFNLLQDVEFVNGKRVPRDYVVTNSLEVRVDDLGVLGELMDEAVQAGATSVGGVRFDLRDRASAEREALRLAVADARARADAAAAGAGTRVISVVRIEEEGVPQPPTPVPMRMAMAAAAPMQETPVSPGQIQIQAGVTLTASVEAR